MCEERITGAGNRGSEMEGKGEYLDDGQVVKGNGSVGRLREEGMVMRR